MRALVLLALPSAALAAPPAPHVSPDDALGRDLHVRLDADATWGIGSQMYVGAALHGLGQLPVWHGPRATGSLDVGLRVAYGNEAQWLAPWIDPEQVQGVPHRVAVQASVGHAFHLSPRRRLALGVNLLGGVNVVHHTVTITYAAEDVCGTASATDVAPLVGGQASLSWRVHDRVGLHLGADVPFPTTSSYRIGLASVGLGVTFHLR